MWTRAELKERGRHAFRSNFWLCVLVALILTLASSANSGNNNQNNSSHRHNYSASYQMEDEGFFSEDGSNLITQRGLDYAETAVGNMTVSIRPIHWVYNRIMSGMATILLIVVVVSIVLLSVFLLNPLKIGCYRFFYENLFENAKLGEIGYVFRNGWVNTGLTLLIKDIKIMLWTLLLIVPGIIKTYEYRMIPYLLAEYPDMSREEAFRRSRALMDGQKMNAFILDLSFIGWHFLGAITLGLGEILWAKPYHESTNAALYAALRDFS